MKQIRVAEDIRRGASCIYRRRTAGVLFKRLEWLGPIIVDDLKCRPAESLDGIAGIVRDRHVEKHFSGIGVEDRRKPESRSIASKIVRRIGRLLAGTELVNLTRNRVGVEKVTEISR